MKHIKEFAQLFESQQELTLEQKDWLDECTDGTWSVNHQTGLIDVGRSFDCSKQGLRDFKGVRFGKVGLSFVCAANSLTSLDGAPQSVDGNFYCDNNYLTSLEGAPESIEGSFYCSYNSLTSLKGSPQSVKGSFFCSNNSLTSLEGAPQSVGENLYCPFNPISAGTINGVVMMMSYKGITLEQAVSDLWNETQEEDRVYLAKHNPDLPPEEKKEYLALERHQKRLI